MESFQAYLDYAEGLKGKLKDDFHWGLYKLTVDYGIDLPVACRELVNLLTTIIEEVERDPEKHHQVLRRMIRVYRDPYQEGSIHDGRGTGLGITTWKVRVGNTRINYTVENNMPVIQRTIRRDRAYTSTTRRK